MGEMPYRDTSLTALPRRERRVAEHAFIWIAWALAAAFWAATLTTFAGIVGSIANTTPEMRGVADLGGVAWMVIDVVGGVVVLGGALAYASLMYARRNRRLDPVGEAATAALYDAEERQSEKGLAAVLAERVRMDRES